MLYKIAIGSDLGTVENRELRWPAIANRLSRHEVAMKKGGRYFVGGGYTSTHRHEKNLISRSLLTLDIDDTDLSLVELGFLLEMKIDGAFVAYSTFSHSTEHPKIRIVVPLSREVSPDEYREVARTFAAPFGLTFDPCSYVPNQLMYLPACPDLTIAWSMVQDGDPWEVPAEIRSPVPDEDGDPDNMGALEKALANRPLDMSPDEVDAYLRAYPAQGLEYDDWIRVGAALHHQFEGDHDEGYQRWIRWSEQSDKHEPKQMAMKWRSFGRSVRIVTFASVIYHAREAGALPVAGGGEVSVVEQEAFESLCEQAAEVEGIGGYDKFKAKVQAMSLTTLPLDKRAMLADEVVKAWGKEAGLTKSDVKRALAPVKKKGGDVARMLVPVWAKHWIYVQMTCEFYNIELHYGIKREAFNATYGREIEAVTSEKTPADYTLNDCMIDIVVDAMFWPGAGMFFDYEGKRMLNTYRDTGIAPCLVMDPDGQTVVDLFMDHLRFTLADEGEQRMLIDFMAWIVQNPGQKINWAILLQGAQGVGKSYFGTVMTLILGEMARSLEPGALSGRFTGWAYGSVLNVIEEIRIAGESRYEVMDRLKPFISNSTIQIEEKGRDHRTVPNFCNYMAFTNHKDSIPLHQGDRRYAPLFSRVQSEAQLFAELGGEDGAAAYFTKLFNETERRADALAFFLRNWKVSADFNAKGRAPHTKARDVMIDLNVSPERTMVEDALLKHKCSVVAEGVLDVTWLTDLCRMEGDDLPKTRALSAILLDMGWEQVTGRRIWCGKTKKHHYVWHKGGEAEARKTVQAFHDDPDYCPF